MPMPLEIVGLGKAQVKIVWEDHHESEWTTRDLRLRCSCAFCVEEGTGRELIDPDKIPRDITIKDMELVGSYGVRIEFSDGHGTGIYRFGDLLADCPCRHCQARRAAREPSSS